MQDPTLFQPMKPHFPEEEQLKCPRCDSTNTKFCYYNNYNLSQPRHFCKNCKRYWTKGGALRNIPVGGGSKKSTKRSSSSSNTKRPATSSSPSLLASSGHLGNLLEGLNSSTSGSNLKSVQMEEFRENVSSSSPIMDPGSGRILGLEMQNENAKSFLSLHNGDSSCWNGTSGCSNLAIYTPSSNFQYKQTNE